MIQIALLRWKSETTAEEIGKVTRAVHDFHLRLEGVTSFVAGSDLGLGGTHQYDFGMITHFVNRAEWESYMSLPEHKEISAKIVLPITDDFAVIQMESDES
jgi:Stress responsive A/B Barrel Domain